MKFLVLSLIIVKIQQNYSVNTGIYGKIANFDINDFVLLFF